MATDGTPLRFFTDTGGADFLCRPIVSALGVDTETVTLEGTSVEVATWPEFQAESWIPGISLEEDPRSPALKGRLLVRPEGSAPGGADGMLGQAWFGGRIWTLDYAAGRLVLHDSPPNPNRSHGSAPLGFPRRADSRRGTHFPSIEATIDGTTIPFLFDSGATVRLSENARRKVGVDPSEVAACFVTTSIFDRWASDHPDWPLIEDADVNAGGQPMIQVPAVTIAGLEVGPAWFTRRPDANFHEFMSRMMDRTVEGALGGSLLRHFVVTVNYPDAIAHFTRT